MTSRDFCYWLQGHFELSETSIISEKASGIIKNHLAMVFKHEIDPGMGSAAHQAELSSLHEGESDYLEYEITPARTSPPPMPRFCASDVKINC